MTIKISLTASIACLMISGQAFSNGNHHYGSNHHSHSNYTESDSTRGFVFLDKNENGVRDNNEPGIRDVPVSNGIDVVMTNGRGEYEIDVPKDSILFISKPAKFDVPVNADNLPQFYYIHYPDGTPDIADWQYDVIEPTGPLPEQIDFALSSSKNSKEFKAMAFADPQAKSEEDQDMVREDVVNELIGNPHGALFGITAGDVVYDTLSLYERHNSMFGKIGIPMWNVPGNHDINFESPNNKYATQTFSKHYGPTYYSYDYGDVHFVALNNVQYKGLSQGRYDNTVYRGYIPDEQLEWLKNDLKHVDRDKLIVITTHIPLVTYALDGKGERYAMGDNINTVNLDKLIEVLMPFDKVYAIAGHDTSNSWKVQIDHSHGWYGTPWIAHTLAEVRGNGWPRGPRDERDVRAATMQDGNPNGYYVLHFDSADVTPQFIPSGQKGNTHDRMRIVLDPLMEGTRDIDDKIIAINRGQLAPGTKIVVNLFDGGERDDIKISLDGAEFVEMQQTLRNDPFMVRQHAQYTGTPDAFSSPQPSSHVWEFELPYDMDRGLHTAVVVSVDEFGQKAEQAFTFEVLAD